MSLSILLGILAIVAALAASSSAVVIADALRKQGTDVNMSDFTLLRRRVLWYLSEYKALTTQTRGHVGHAYYSYIAAILMMLLLVAGALIARFGG